jgi:hypothetical protein
MNKPHSAPQHLNFGSVPAPSSVHPVRHMNEWDRYRHVCSLDDDGLHALRLELLAEGSDLMWGNLMALKDHLSPEIQRGHSGYKRKMAHVNHLCCTYGLDEEDVLAIQEPRKTASLVRVPHEDLSEK